MQSDQQMPQEEFLPKMIVWSLSYDPEASALRSGYLETNECLLVLENIARVSSPIIVITGKQVLRRPDLLEIVGYGSAVGLKIVVESEIADINDDLMRRLRAFGPRTIRALLNGSILENPDTRFDPTPEFDQLEKTVKRLIDNGFQLHLGTTVANADLRQLAFNLDYAIKHTARGLYLHLCFLDQQTVSSGSEDLEKEKDEFLLRIAEMKQFLPSDMYFSPQCVRYQYKQEHNGHSHSERNGESEWSLWCLGGKTFAFITDEGKVQLCAGSPMDCGDLRDTKFDFGKIWFESDILKRFRAERWTCSETRNAVRQILMNIEPSVISNAQENPQT